MSKNYNDPSTLNKFQRFFYEYGRYHRDPTNVIIHIICIPIITLTLFLMFDHVSFNLLKSPFNIFYILHAILVPLYLYVDFVSGALTSVLYPLIYTYTKNYNLSCSCLNLSNINMVVLIHVLAWILQFIGHGKFEKRKPALMDNIFLIFNAPVFVFIELLYLVGYRKAEIKETLQYIDANITEYRKSKSA